MKITLRRRFKSITALTTDELPDFAVLIGRNGAGKTQLLDALKEGTATIPGIHVNEIELYDMTSFRSPNSGGAGRGINQFAQRVADAYLIGKPGGQPPVEIAAEVFGQFTSDIEGSAGLEARDKFVRALRDETRGVTTLTTSSFGDRASAYKTSLYEKVTHLRNGEPRARRSVKRTAAALLGVAMRLGGKLAHELTRADIMRAAYFEGGTLANSLSEVFTGYKLDQFSWAHTRIETEHVSFADLISEYRTKHPPPWETLREILSAMRGAAGDDGLFDFDFSDPDDLELNMGNYENFSFRAAMTNRTTGTSYEINSLSSGEQVLMALCMASFNQYLGRLRPKLLLLDELDAVLHPSMIAAMVTTLKSLFVKHGTKVLMTSHSAMTLATLNEEDIFRIVRTHGQTTVSRTTQADAIDELSEGLATVGAGLRIAASDEAKVTILTEGNNAKHLRKWVELTFPKDVHIFDELVQHTSASQLLAYGRLLGRLKTNTQFVIVWDCDAVSQAETLRRELPNSAKVTPFAFAKRGDNTIARHGIENVYDEGILQQFCISKTDSDGTLLARELPKSRKPRVAEHVLQHGTSQYFTHFHDLHALVSALLSSQQDAPPQMLPGVGGQDDTRSARAPTG